MLKLSSFSSLLGALGDLYSLIFYAFVFLIFLCASVVNRIAFAFARSAASSLTVAATTAAAVANCTAVDTREHSAEVVSFQRLLPNFPPT